MHAQRSVKCKRDEAALLEPASSLQWPLQVAANVHWPCTACKHKHLSTAHPSCLTLSQVFDPEVEHTNVEAVQNEHGGAKNCHTNEVIQLVRADLTLCFAATSS